MLERYLPRSERRTALWLAFGGAAIVEATELLHRSLVQSLTAAVPAPPHGAALAIEFAAESALVLLAVLMLVRLAKAPRVLALYLIALAGVRIVLELPRVDAVTSLALMVGAFAAGWLADWVTLDKIRVFPEGEGPPEEVVTPHPDAPAVPFAFLGWTGRPVAGDALVALVYVAAILASGLVSRAVVLVSLALGSGDGLQVTAFLIGQAISVVGIGVVAYAATRLTDVRTLWLQVVGGVLVPVFTTVRFYVFQAPGAAYYDAVGIIALAAAPLFALLGTWVATRGEAATLPASDSQDPGSDAAPDDTAGGSDG
ncbi:MAG: hypothetical protein FDZ75_03445 [Actinobacteria bacterium]|nr:MAG: hypothetical protein FDZ75_03445 [Actinomycetota bacterium]